MTKINGYEDQIKKLSDQNLADKTAEFKNRIKNGETLDQLLPEAFAVVEKHPLEQLDKGLLMFSLSVEFFFTREILLK